MKLIETPALETDRATSLGYKRAECYQFPESEAPRFFDSGPDHWPPNAEFQCGSRFQGGDIIMVDRANLVVVIGIRE